MQQSRSEWLELCHGRAHEDRILDRLRTLLPQVGLVGEERNALLEPGVELGFPRVRCGRAVGAGRGTGYRGDELVQRFGAQQLEEEVGSTKSKPISKKPGAALNQLRRAQPGR